MTTLTATRARQELFKMLNRVARGHETFEITSKAGDAILIAEEDYEGLIETLELLSTPGFLRRFRKAREEIKVGKTYPLKEIFGR